MAETGDWYPGGDVPLTTLKHTELAFFGPDGVDIWVFGVQPSTTDIAERHTRSAARKYTLVVQKIGTMFEVYDLKTLNKQMLNTWTIGLPVATDVDADAALMKAILLS